MKIKKILKGVLIVGLLAALSGLFAFNSKKAEAESGGYDISTPTIMVPGTGASVNRFDSLIRSLKKTYNDVSVLKITVNEDSSLDVSGSISPTSDHPIIVIGFENSSDDTLANQAKWYKIALNYATKRFHFATYNYLGHSNGGLVITQYLENELSASDPQLAKLITLGTPYNYTEWADNSDSSNLTEVKNTTDQLKAYLANKTYLPKNIQMVNIAGTKDSKNTDGTVPLTSVLSGKLIYGDSTSYQEMTVSAGHSDLVTNSQVENEIIKTFW